MKFAVVVVFSCLLAPALVGTVPVRPPPSRISTMQKTLEEMMKTLKHLAKQPKHVGDTLTPNAIDGHECKAEDFCKAEKVLSSIDHEDFRANGKIVRQLKEYNKHNSTKCAVQADTEVPLSDILRKLLDCAQKTFRALP
ncbi:hypothetical protein ANANG_G00150000 [Anguilla anguilla]|uniref:Interleukin-4 n=1 Tax=Anguilla anguilla TaxID=7936 RepID=A0A9D3M9R8_ANGAN|nr:hypothetical protein ANANG_G00150000 [Anguilla anguilla]